MLHKYQEQEFIREREVLYRIQPTAPSDGGGNQLWLCVVLSLEEMKYF